MCPPANIIILVARFCSNIIVLLMQTARDQSADNSHCVGCGLSHVQICITVRMLCALPGNKLYDGRNCSTLIAMIVRMTLKIMTSRRLWCFKVLFIIWLLAGKCTSASFTVKCMVFWIFDVNCDVVIFRVRYDTNRAETTHDSLYLCTLFAVPCRPILYPFYYI